MLSLVKHVIVDDDERVLVAEAQVARQREVIAHLEARGSDTSEAKSTLSALRYSLRLIRLHRRRLQSNRPVPRIARNARPR